MNIFWAFYIVSGFLVFVILVALFGLNIGLVTAKSTHKYKVAIIILVGFAEFIVAIVAGIFWPIGLPAFIMYFSYEWGKQTRK